MGTSGYRARDRYVYTTDLTWALADWIEDAVPGALSYVHIRGERVRAKEASGTETHRCTIEVPVHGAWLVEEALNDLDAPFTVRAPRSPPDPMSKALLARLAEEGTAVIERIVAAGEMTTAQAQLPTHYQRAQAAWSASRPWSFLCWAPGAGKTFGATLAALSRPGPVLVVCPSGVRHEWWSQVQKYTTIRPWRQKVEGAKRKGDQTLKQYLAWCADNRQRPWVIIGQEMIHHALPIVEALQPAILIFDEMHQLGNPKRWSATEDKYGDVTFAGRKTKGGTQEQRSYYAMLVSRYQSVNHRIGLTATPFGAGRPRRIWAQLDLLDPGGFAHSYKRYATRYCALRMTDLGFPDDKGSSNQKELRQRVGWLLHRVTHTESHGALPSSRIEVTIVPKENQNAAGRFDAATTFGQAIKRAAKSKETHGSIAEIRLAEASSRKQKQVVHEAVEGARGGGKVLVFTVRKQEVLDIDVALGKAFAKEASAEGTQQPTVLTITGDTPEAERQRLLDLYAGPMPSGVILVATGHSIGTGKDGMQYSNLALFSGLPVQADHFQQWIGRIDRMGDTDRLCSTLVRILVAEGTYDEHQVQVLLPNLRNVADFFDDGREGEDHLTDIIEQLESGGKDANAQYDNMVGSLMPVIEEDEDE